MRGSDLRRLALLDLALLSALVLASRLALVLHEFAGHGLAALAFGASSLRAELSLFGGGWLCYTLPPGGGLSAGQEAVISAAGIAVNLATGGLAWLLAAKIGRDGDLRRLFLLLLGAGSVGQALFYLANGFHYGTGDPAGFLAAIGEVAWFQPFWILFVPPFAVVAWAAGRRWLGFLSAHADAPTVRSRIGWTAATLGVALSAYSALWAATWRPGTDHTMAELRLEEEIARETRRREWEGSEAPPGGPPLAPVRVAPEEVRDRVPPPLPLWTMAAAAAAGGAWALRKPASAGAAGRIRPAVAAGMAAAAALTLAAIGLLFR